MPTLQLADGVLSYELTGNGPPVLLIQGCGVCGSGWEYQVAELSRSFQCLTFDNRGIGKSTADSSRLTIEQMARDAQSLMDAVGWESAHVVGHSMGGLIAEQLALDAPARVRTLSLLCTFARGFESVKATPRVVWLGIRTRVGTRAMRRRALLLMQFSTSYLRSHNIDQLADDAKRIIGRDLADTLPIMIKQLRAMLRHDPRARLHELSRIPTLVVTAAHDPVAQPSYGRGLSVHIPGSRYIEIPDAAHAVILQLPERVNQLLTEHFTH